MKISNFDKTICNQVSTEALKALENVARNFGLTIKRSGGKYTDGSYTAKFTFAVVDTNGVPSDFERIAPLYGLSTADYGRTFTDDKGEMFKLSGINPGRSKFAFTATHVRTGKVFKFTASYLKMCLNAMPIKHIV